MQVSTVGQQNIYNHADLVNNPPYITNTPLYDYMKERKMLLSDTFGTKPYYSNINLLNNKNTDMFISSLYISTVAILGICVCKAYKNIKGFLVK